MTQMVNRSRQKRAKEDKEGADDTPKPPEKGPKEGSEPAPGAAATPPAEAPKLTDLLGTALRFGTKGGPKAPAGTPAAPPAVPPPAPAAPAEPPAPAPAAKKVAKTKKAPTIDPAAIAREAATAATEAALRTVGAGRPAAAEPEPTEGLADDDKRDYEVAQHLAKIDPRFKDAPQIILHQVQQAEEYATRWENANPGKVYDPTDEEHNDFYASMRRPWTEADFRRAEVKMEARKEAEELMAEHNKKLAGLEEDHARSELAPSVDRTFNEVTGTLAKMVGDDVHKVLTTGGWEELHKVDPVQARVLATTLDQMHPFIAAAIQIDDPRQRVPINPQDPVHAQWNQVVHTGEARLAGVQQEDGRVFARRADYVRMTPAQQRQHWFLTTDMIIQGVIDYAAQQVKTVTEQQREMLKSMGYVRANGAPAQNSPGTPAPPVTPAPATPQVTPPAPPTDKPVSPTVGGGAKIDDTDGAPKSKEAALMQQISGILFAR